MPERGRKEKAGWIRSVFSLVALWNLTLSDESIHHPVHSMDNCYANGNGHTDKVV